MGSKILLGPMDSHEEYIFYKQRGTVHLTCRK